MSHPGCAGRHSGWDTGVHRIICIGGPIRKHTPSSMFRQIDRVTPSPDVGVKSRGTALELSGISVVF